MRYKLLGALALIIGLIGFGAAPALASTTWHHPEGCSQDRCCNDEGSTWGFFLGCLPPPHPVCENREIFTPVWGLDRDDCCLGFITMNEVRGTYYTGALVVPGEKLRYNHVTYTVKTVTPVLHGIHTGQSIVTFWSAAGLPATGDVFVNFSTGFGSGFCDLR